MDQALNLPPMPMYIFRSITEELKHICLLSMQLVSEILENFLVHGCRRDSVSSGTCYKGAHVFILTEFSKFTIYQQMISTGVHCNRAAFAMWMAERAQAIR